MTVPIRILFIHATRDATAEYDVHRTLAENAKRGVVDCTFVWQDCSNDLGRRKPAATGRTLFYDFGRNLSLTPRPSRRGRAVLMARRFPGALLFLFRTVRETQPDLIYTSQQNYDMRLVWLLRRVLRIPHLVHVAYNLGPWLGWGTLRILRQAETVVACSDFIRDQCAVAGVAPGRLTTLHNAAETDRFAVPIDRAAKRRELGVELDTPVVVAVGRLDPGKGFPCLIDAMLRVREQIPAARLLICGATFTRDQYDMKLRAQVKELELQECVTFLGQRSDVPEIMQAADVFCLPTVMEPFGLVFVEAMAAGLPVVACDSGGVPEIVQDGVTGFLSPVDDSQAVAEHLIRLLRDPSLRVQMGAAGKIRAQTDFAPSRLAAQWQAILEGVMVQNGQARCRLDQQQTPKSSSPAVQAGPGGDR